MIGENAFAYEQEGHVQAMLANPMTYEPFPPEIIGRETTFYFGKHTGKKLVETRLNQAGIRATPAQIDEIVKRIRGTHESLDKGEAQMTFYQIKRLMKDLRKGLTEEEFWRMVEQITRQKPKLPTGETKPT
jgi:isopropylmalate/homocitrate/citramalate synthase